MIRIPVTVYEELKTVDMGVMARFQLEQRLESDPILKNIGGNLYLVETV